MRFISWNVNGLRACLQKGFESFFRASDADVFCIQETKMHPDQMDIHFDGYESYWNSAIKKGYSGTAVFSRIKPLSVAYDIQKEEHVGEGRVITLEFEELFLVNVYTPNAQDKLARIDYRMQWEDDFRAYLKKLDSKKPVVLCGDLNVAHEEIDLRHPKPNRGNAGFSDQERGKMTELLGSGFVDSFRHLYPDKEEAYTWWSYFRKARESNSGWRIDYFIVSDVLKSSIVDSVIYSDVLGSDHCPVGLILDIYSGR
jgi:exodeoxyribonuclease-3